MTCPAATVWGCMAPNRTLSRTPSSGTSMAQAIAAAAAPPAMHSARALPCLTCGAVEVVAVSMWSSLQLMCGAWLRR